MASCMAEQTRLIYSMVCGRALRYKLFFVKALSKQLRKVTIITKRFIAIKRLRFMGRIYDYNDYNETINNETNEF